jgi:hypothetical protein
MFDEGTMSTVVEKKGAAIRYWEKRRIAYNLALVPGAFLGWGICGAVSGGVGDEAKIGTVGLLMLFLLSAVGANICYSVAYALEFLFLSEAEESLWTKRGRTLVFLGGCILAFCLAVAGGRYIAFLQYSWVR